MSGNSKLMISYSFVVGILLLNPIISLALEVDREVIPRIILGGRVISTVEFVDLDTEPDKENAINLSDSTILLQFDKRMFGDGVAGAVVGLKEIGDNDQKELVFHELHTNYWNRDYSITIGRTRLRNTVIEFPVLRDDDFLAYTHVGNASSNEEYQQLYANQQSIDWYFDQKVQSLGLWNASRMNGDQFTNAPQGLDSWGINYTYSQSEDLQYIKWLRHAGLNLDQQEVSSATGVRWMRAVIAGMEFNLNDNPLSNWSMGVQAIFNEGLADARQVSAVSEAAMAKSKSIVISIRHTGRPFLLTRSQSAVTVAYKDYSDIDNATQWSIAPNYIYRIGDKVDLVAQAIYTDFGDALGNGQDYFLQLGIVFNLEARFNDTIGERNSILNLEHGYIK